MIFFQVDFVAILFAAIAGMLVGALWYGPLFGKKWMSLVGITSKDIEKAKNKMPKTYGLSFVSILVMSYAMSIVFSLFNVQLVQGALISSIIIWAGFVATTHLVHFLYEDRSMKLYFLIAGHHLVELIVMGIVLVKIGSIL